MTSSPNAAARREVSPTLRELRFALAMNGGVSLAVWIGGVCDELLRLCREGQELSSGDLARPEPAPEWSVYRQVCWAARVQPRVDVLTGASAGGMNSVFLALALIYGHRDLSQLRSLWIDAGGFGELLRDPLDAHAPSLLKGDEYFLGKLEEAIRQLADGVPDPQVPITLILTATSMSGVQRTLTNDFGDPIHETEHAVTLRFRHRAAGQPLDQSDFVPLAEVDQERGLATERMVRRLARACRSTASFPGAFEPSRVVVAPGNELTADQPLDCLLRRQATFVGTNFLIDGGTLVNLPVEEAIQAVFEQPAATAVRRVFAMIVPDPSASATAPMAAFDPPSIQHVVVSAVSTLPRNQTVGRFLDELDDHNRQVDKTRSSRLAVLEAAHTDVVTTGAALFPAYQTSRRGTSKRMVADNLAREIDKRRPSMPDDLRQEWAAQLAALTPPWIPLHFAWTSDADLTRWGTSTVRRSAGRVLHLIGELEERTDHTATDADLNSWRTTATTAIVDMGPIAVAASDNNIFRNADFDVPAEGIAEGIAELLRGWIDEREIVASALHELGAVVNALADRGFGRTAVDGCRRGGRRGLDLLLALEVIENTFAGFGMTVEQRVERVRVDSIATSPIDEHHRKDASGKVAGVQLGHFGAFLKASWRANDWMWGRLDGSFDLIDVVLHEADPARMEALARVHDTADVKVCLKKLRHAEIVLEETPEIVQAIADDRADGGATGRAARNLEREWAKTPEPGFDPVERATALLSANRIGAETIADHAGSDLLTRISITAFATATTVVHRSGPKMLATPVTALRYVALLAWGMLRAAFGGPIGRTFSGLVFGIGAAIVAVDLYPGTSLGPVAPIGVALFAAGVILCLLRAPFLLVPLLALVTVPQLLRHLPVEPWSWWPDDWPFPTIRERLRWLPTAAFLLCALVIGVATRPRWMQSVRRDAQDYERRLEVLAGGWTREPPQ